MQTDATTLNQIIVGCYMFLRAVRICCIKFETGQTFSYVQTDATIPNMLGQECWQLLRLNNWPIYFFSINEYASELYITKPVLATVVA